MGRSSSRGALLYRRGVRRPSGAPGMRGFWRLGVLVLVLAVVGLVGWKGWRVYSLAQALRRDVQVLQGLASATPDAELLDGLQVGLGRARTTAQALYGEAGPLLPVVGLLGWVPEYGGDLVAAGPLLDVAVHATVAVDELMGALAPLARSYERTQPLSATLALVEELEGARPRLERAREASEQAMEAWAGVPYDGLSPVVRGQVERVGMLLPVVDAAAHLSLAVEEVAPVLLPLAGEVGQPFSMGLVEQVRAARPELEGARPAIERAAEAWGQIVPDGLPPGLRGRVEQVGPLVPLLRASVDLAVAADETLPIVEAVLMGHRNALNGELVAYLAQVQPQIEQARVALEQAAEAWGQVAVEELPGSLRGQVQPVGELLALTRDGLDVAQVLPELLGVDGRQEYLFIAQNPDELRPTGGFISAVGVLTFEGGELVDYRVDNTDRFVPGSYPRPPDPIERYLGIGMWIFRDANWSPDFPTAVGEMLPLYEAERGERLENMLAFTPTALRYLLEATGPIVVGDGGVAVSAEGLQAYIRDEYNASFALGVHRKAFLEPLMDAIIQRIRTDPGSLDALAVGRAMMRALDEHHLLVFVQEPEAGEVLARRGWDGSVRPGGQDFLMVVDANVGYSKANFYVQQVMTYTVDLSDPDAPMAEVLVRHRHGLDRPQECGHWKDYGGVDVEGLSPYEVATNRCYWDYMRVFVPGGSLLLEARTEPVPAAWGLGGLDNGSVRQGSGEWGSNVLGTFLIVPPAGERTTVFRYRLPAGVVMQDGERWHYRLMIQKQPGREGLPFALQVRLPLTARVVATGGHFAGQGEPTLFERFELGRDQQVEVVFGYGAGVAGGGQSHGDTP